MKKILAYILSVVIILSGFAFMAKPVQAAGSASVSVGSGSGDVGDVVSVGVSVSANSDVFMSQIYVSYDASGLEYTGGSGTGAGGSITIVDENGNTGFSLSFRILSTGSHSVSIGGGSLILDTNADPMEVSAGSGSIRGNEPSTDPVYSDNNTLASLDISDGTLSPGFSGGRTNYSVSVGSNIDTLYVSASPEDGSASVSISDTSLSYGSNTIVVTCTAENGAQKDYVINVTREGTAETEPTSQTETNATTAENETSVTEKNSASQNQAEESMNLTINGVAYSVASDLTGKEIPNEYEKKTIIYAGRSIEGAVGTKDGLTLIYLNNTDNKGTSGFYVYDAASKSYAIFNRIVQSNNSYVILAITDSIEKPEGFTVSSYTINGLKAQVLMSDSGDYCLIYASTSTGNKGWYTYDMKEGTIQRYIASTTGSTSANGTTVDTAEQNTKKLDLIIYIVCGLCIILVIILIIIAIRSMRRKPDSEEFEEDDILALEDDEKVFDDDEDILLDEDAEEKDDILELEIDDDDDLLDIVDIDEKKNDDI